MKRVLQKIVFPIQGLGYRLCMRFYHPRSEDRKYYVSICAIFKNEGKYMREWIEFHKIVGVEHFYLYNNFSDDNYREVLAPYITSGLVELFDWPVPQGQMSAYADCISRAKKESQWVGFIDLDEFVVPNHNDNLKDYLTDFHKKHRPAVKLYWRVFGSSGHIQRDTSRMVTGDFHCCWAKYDEVGKCFWNTDYDIRIEYALNKCFHHYMWGSYRNVIYPPVDANGNLCIRDDFECLRTHDLAAQINHYFTKSYGEYAQKINRGDPFYVVNPKNDAYFFAHEMKCQAVDYRIYKYMILLKNNLGVKE